MLHSIKTSTCEGNMENTRVPGPLNMKFRDYLVALSGEWCSTPLLLHQHCVTSMPKPKPKTLGSKS